MGDAINTPTEEDRILKTIKFRGETYLHRGDICLLLEGILKGCASFDGKQHLRELLKTLDCDTCEGEDPC